jgi:two-component system cell cycle sensor histidine kinase/response regulator CckA
MKKKSILIVDDDFAARESLRFLLKDRYNVHIAENGFKALEILKNKRIDTVTLDLSIPGIHGRTILNEIKKTQPNVEIILVSGYSLSKWFESSLPNSIYKYIPKPFDCSEMLTAISSSLKKRVQCKAS